MRIGIYLGRHHAGGGGMGVYARSLVRNLVCLLERADLREMEVVFYGDSAILTPELLDEIELAPVLSSVARPSVPLFASSYFRPLPNGARVRILVRLLGERFGRKLQATLDQAVVPILIRLDRIDVLHSLANCGFFFGGVPQLITVHDVFQAWPDYTSEPGRRSWGLSAQHYYRLLFRRQFSTAAHIITDTKGVADEVVRRYRFDAGRISVIPLGLDEVFLDAFNDLRRSAVSRQQHEAPAVGRPPGYALVFASPDPRKNFERTWQAWLALPDAERKRGAVIVCADSSLRRRIQKRIVRDGLESYVTVLDWVDRSRLPALYRDAGASVLPTLAEGFGFPAVESLALGTPVVSAPLEILRRGNDFLPLVYPCDPLDPASITRAIGDALYAKGGLAMSAQPKMSVTPASNGAPRPRAMRDAIEETVAVYKQVVMRYAVRKR
ncbi:MAG: glycosyltransferase family 4 protein [Bdellovibrionales bacterium]|nr:glycosyltransferase family 4 protein [Bdellovibrionales bacterium]